MLQRQNRVTGASLLQGYETFESCFKTVTGRNILPYSTSDDGGTLMQWLSTLEEVSSRQARCMVTSLQGWRGSAECQATSQDSLWVLSFVAAMCHAIS